MKLYKSVELIIFVLISFTCCSQEQKKEISSNSILEIRGKKISGDFEQAVNYHKKNLLLLQRISNSEDYAKYKIWGGSIEKTYLELSDIYIDLKDVDAAITYMHLAKNVLDSTEGNYHDDYRLRNKINELEINLLDDKAKLAKENLREALKLIPEHYKQAFSNYTKNYYYGLISYHEGDFDKAIRSFEAIDTITIRSYERAGFFHDDFYKILYKSYLKNNDLKKADYFFEKHLASLRGKMIINNSVNSNFKDLEISRYNEEVEALKNKSSKQHTILIWIFFISLFITILVVVPFRKRQKKIGKNWHYFWKGWNVRKRKKNTPVPIKINDKEVQRIIKKINELEDMGYYLKHDCTLANLAKKLKTNTTYLSKIFNSYYQKKFNTYINDLRINYVIEKIKNDTQFRKYTIKSLANEVGFKSKESFNAAFKKRTGVLPSALIKKLSTD
jgi:AraC-like DNA-binding protein